MPDTLLNRSRKNLQHYTKSQSAPGAGIAEENKKSEYAILSTERAGGRFQQNLFELFSEMEEKDGHLYSLIQTRINTIVGLNFTINDSGSEDETITQFVRQAISKFPRFREFLKSLLDSISKGYSVIELVWEYDSDGRLYVSDWRPYPQEYFVFDQNYKLRLIESFFKSDTTTLYHTSAHLNSAKSFPAPDHKFVTHFFGRDARNPYGRGLCQRAYWYYWFKKNTLRSWSLFNEKYGAPLAVAKVDSSVSDQDKQAILDVLESIQTDAGIVLPESIQLDYLEANRSGDGETFQRLADWCNDEMARIILGGTLTSGEGRRSGSLALGEVHESVRQDYLESDAVQLEAVLNETLLKWIVELNFPIISAPKIKFDTAVNKDLEQQLRIDSELVRIGVPVSKDELYNRYGRTKPTDRSNAISHDDSNLFQYHLRFGILTVNEVRERLNLPPVSWGNRSTSGVSELENPASNGGRRKTSSSVVTGGFLDAESGEAAAEREVSEP